MKKKLELNQKVSGLTAKYLQSLYSEFRRCIHPEDGVCFNRAHFFAQNSTNVKFIVHSLIRFRKFGAVSFKLKSFIVVVIRNMNVAISFFLPKEILHLLTRLVIVVLKVKVASGAQSESSIWRFWTKKYSFLL
jgi:hypothetical protein